MVLKDFHKKKIIKIGNIFNVSIDYLLKSSVEIKGECEDSYYVSKEIAD